MKRDIFKKRIEAKPLEYPELMEFKDAIRHSYWLHSEFNYDPDVQDYKINIVDKERTVMTRAMLAISQVEVTVKRFWADLYHYFPKPEIDAIGVSFGESEVRHQDAYSFLLEKLGMNDLFSQIHEFKPLINRVKYMEDFMKDKAKDKKGFVLALVLFSLFIEHISLFGQFYIMMAFNKRKNLFKGISNAIEATSKEEELHGRFGIELYNILKSEHSDLFDKDFYETLTKLAEKAYKAELGIIDWIFEDGDLDFLTKNEVRNYIANRYNISLTTLGLPATHKVDYSLLKETKWFDEELLATKENDFFNKRSTDYAKKDADFSPDNLF